MPPQLRTAATRAREDARQTDGRFGPQILVEAPCVALVELDHGPPTPSMVELGLNRSIAMLDLVADDLRAGWTAALAHRRDRIIEAIAMSQEGRLMLADMDLGDLGGSINLAALRQLVDAGARRAEALIRHERTGLLGHFHRRIDLGELRDRLRVGAEIEKLHLTMDADHDCFDRRVVAMHDDDRMVLESIDGDEPVVRSWGGIRAQADDRGHVFIFDSFGHPQVAYLFD